MNAVLRHISLRLWITALAGSLVCLTVLPWWQRVFGLDGLLIPVSIILIAIFMLTGWVLDRLGMIFIKRLVNEAAVWERAGMTAEAEGAFQRAVALFDSFWFSPMNRRGRTPWLTARLARFYIGQSFRSRYADTMVRGYLIKNPDDSEVASVWLEQLLNREDHTALDYEAAARIGEALVDDTDIQQWLMEFHLANSRADFHAVHTYQRVWQQRQPLPPGLLKPLVELLLQKRALTHWSLEVYTEAFKQGHQNALTGIAGCACWLHPTIENQTLLQAAKKLLAQFDTDQITSLARRFKPAQPVQTATGRRITIREMGRSKADAMAKQMIPGFRRMINELIASASSVLQGILSILTPRRAAIGFAVAVGFIVIIIAGRQMVQRAPKPPEPVATVETAPTVTDPFTIQVAAYLKSDDAQRFVDQLKQHGLDAFWTEATSANRKWYQVKVSHFETKEQARLYGQDLKSKGLIDDYYVANYKPR